MRNLSRRKKNNIIIASLCGVLLLMGIGYAAFSSQLRINGTSNISSNWDIRITNIETMLPSESGGDGIPDGYNISEPTYTPTSATFNAGFELPGSMIVYIVEVSNLGTIDGQVTMGNLSCGDNENIMCMAQAYDANPMEGWTDNYFYFNEGNQDYSGINFPLKTNEKHYIMIMVGYDDVTEQPTDLDANIKLDLTYEQYEYRDPNTPIPSGETTIVGGQEVDVVSGGNGLYKDEYESGRYVYKGANPNNYIKFDNGEVWRIISKETDGTYKIVRNAFLAEKMLFDSEDLRDAGSNGAGGTYCANSYFGGCNAWAITNNFSNGTYTGTVLKDAEINIYLNNEYYNGLDLSVKNNIVLHTWNVGPVEVPNDDLSEQLNSEKKITWAGNIGLISRSDYLRANSNVLMCANSWNSNCNTTNWMYISGEKWWTISPNSDTSIAVSVIPEDGGIWQFSNAYVENGVRPAVYLSSSITFSGIGSIDDPFVITN